MPIGTCRLLSKNNPPPLATAFPQNGPFEISGIAADRKLVEGEIAAEAVGLLGVAAGDGKAGEPIRRQP